MPTYTILGATGKTGGALLQLLLKAPDANINAYVRSKSKLQHQTPGLEQNDRVTIFEGPISNVLLIASALTPNVDAAFCVLGLNENIPGTRIAQDTAHSVVAALCQIRTTDVTYKPPKLIFLSSGSLNPHIYQKHPFAHAFASRAMSNVYMDLSLAETYLRLHESWLNMIFVQPGALVEDEQKGYKLSLDDYAGNSPFLSYLDLAAGMIEMAETGEFDGKSVTLQATSKDVKFEPNAPPQLARGLVWHFAPSLYWIFRSLRLVS